MDLTTEQIIAYLEKIENDEPLPDGITAEQLMSELPKKIDALAMVKDRLESTADETKKRADRFATARKQAKTSLDNFKKRMVFIFRDQEGKKFPGTDFVATVVKKFAPRPIRQPTLDDWTDPKIEKFIKPRFEYTQPPDADIFSFLKSNQYGHYIDMELEWNIDAIKNADSDDIKSFTEIVDAGSHVKFSPKK